MKIFLEPARRAQVAVEGAGGPGGDGGGGPPQEGPPSLGLALSADLQGNLWEVARGSAALSLARFSRAGELLGSLTLPGAAEFGDWSVSFDREGSAVSVDPLEGDPDEAELKKSFECALIRNLRMLNRHLWELRGDLALVSEQIATERAVVARAKGQG